MPSMALILRYQFSSVDPFNSHDPLLNRLAGESPFTPRESIPSHPSDAHLALLICCLFESKTESLPDYERFATTSRKQESQ